jgi:16S rRNA (guanine527-N7)-methyltransferase
MLNHPLIERLRAGLAQLGVAYNDETTTKLLAYLELISKWNKTYNLTAVRDINAMLSVHVFDSLAIVPFVRKMLEKSAAKLLDVGSGAGLPGAILAILNPEFTVVCVDAVGKKAGFIRQVALELKLGNLQVEYARIEQLASVQADVIVSRAFSSLCDFVTLTQAHIKSDGQIAGC